MKERDVVNDEGHQRQGEQSAGIVCLRITLLHDEIKTALYMPMK